MADFLGLYSTYLGGALAWDGQKEWISVRCPVHDDRNPSAGINPKSGVFNCHVCGAMAPSRFLTEVCGIERREARDLVERYRRDEGLIERSNNLSPTRRISSKWQQLYRLSQEMIQPDLPLVQEYTESRGLTYETLRAAGVGYLTAEHTEWRRDSLVFPYLYDGAVTGLRYRDMDLNKHSVEGSHHALWHMDDLDDTPKLVVVVEGETDYLATKQAIGDMATVLSTPTATFRMEWARDFQGVGCVVLIPQADEASQKKFIGAANNAISGLRVLQLPWKRKQYGKDVADWLRYNPPEALRALIYGIANTGRRIYTGEEFDALAESAPKWMIENLLARQEVMVMAGPQKAMKTWLMVNLIRCAIAPGEPFCAIPSMINNNPEPAKVLLIEEEGSLFQLRERLRLTCEGLEWQKYVHVAHHYAFRLDDDADVGTVIDYLRTHKIDLLCIDPFSRCYRVDENSAGEMGQVWGRIGMIVSECPQTSIVILHHFNKAGSISEGWGAFRGSNRTASEADVGMFVEKRARSDGPGVRVKFDGREVTSPTDSSGSDVLKLSFVEGRLLLLD